MHYNINFLTGMHEMGLTQAHLNPENYKACMVQFVRVVHYVWCVITLSICHWYTEILEYYLSTGSWVGFLNSSLLLVCLHLSGEALPI